MKQFHSQILMDCERHVFGYLYVAKQVCGEINLPALR